MVLQSHSRPFPAVIELRNGTQPAHTTTPAGTGVATILTTTTALNTMINKLPHPCLLSRKATISRRRHQATATTHDQPDRALSMKVTSGAFSAVPALFLRRLEERPQAVLREGVVTIPGPLQQLDQPQAIATSPTLSKYLRPSIQVCEAPQHRA